MRGERISSPDQEIPSAKNESSHDADGAKAMGESALISLSELRVAKEKNAAAIAEEERVADEVRKMGSSLTPEAKKRLADLRGLQSEIEQEMKKAQELADAVGASPDDIKRLRPKRIAPKENGTKRADQEKKKAA